MLSDEQTPIFRSRHRVPHCLLVGCKHEYPTSPQNSGSRTSFVGWSRNGRVISVGSMQVAQSVFLYFFTVSLLTFYFEIIIDPQEVAKTVQRVYRGVHSTQLPATAASYTIIVCHKDMWDTIKTRNLTLEQDVWSSTIFITHDPACTCQCSQVTERLSHEDLPPAALGGHPTPTILTPGDHSMILSFQEMQLPCIGP